MKKPVALDGIIYSPSESLTNIYKGLYVGSVSYGALVNPDIISSDAILSVV